MSQWAIGFFNHKIDKRKLTAKPTTHNSESLAHVYPKVKTFYGEETKITLKFYLFLTHVGKKTHQLNSIRSTKKKEKMKRYCSGSSSLVMNFFSERFVSPSPPPTKRIKKIKKKKTATKPCLIENLAP